MSGEAGFETILYAVDGPIATITLNRPEHLNTIVPPMPDEVQAAVGRATQDPEVKVIVLRGAGRSFCAGYDLTAGGSGERYTITEDRWAMRRLVERWQRLWSLPKPTIAQVHGHCLAGATELAVRRLRSTL